MPRVLMMSRRFSSNLSVSIADVMFVKPGESIVLKCNTTANISSMLWSYFMNNGASDQTLTVGFEVNKNYTNRIEVTGITENGEYHLKILNFTRKDEGKYRCIIVDRQIMPVDTYLQMKEAPQNIQFVNSSHTGIVNGTEGHVLNVTCQVIGGKPIGNIYWSSLLSNVTVFNAWPFLTLEFIPEYEHHLMNLTCGVSHEMLKNNITTLVTLYILHKPKIEILRSPSDDIIEGQQMILTCNDKSNPPKINIAWTKDDEILSSYPVYEQSNIQTNDSGNYTCKVSNSLGTELQTILIFVNNRYDKHINDTDSSCQNGSPQFVMIYVFVCSCGTLLFGSAACLIPICTRVKRWCTISDEKPTVLEGQTLSTQ